MKNSFARSLITMLLAAALAMPLPAFAEGSVDAAENAAVNAQTEENAGNSTATGASGITEPSGTTDTVQPDAEPAAPSEEAAAGEGTGENPAGQGSEEPAPAMPEVLADVRIEENPTGTVTITWTAFDGADHYRVSCPLIDDGTPAETEECVQVFKGLKADTDYDFTVEAVGADGEVLAMAPVSIKTVALSVSFDESLYRLLKYRVIGAKRFKINLRSLLKEGRGGYAVVQGGCTDGTYNYYLMVSSSNQKGRVLKLRMKDNKVIARSKVLNVHHGNGMAYDSKRKKLVVIAREKRKQEITLIDASSLKITRQQNVRYNNYKGAGSDSLSATHQKQGLAAIAYVKKYDCYVALERVYHNLLIFDPDTFEAIGMVKTSFDKRYPGTFQAMDADEKYVYLLISYYNKNGKKQPYNMIIALDWNSENLLPVVNASKSKDPKFVKKAWWVHGTNSKGWHDAVIRIKTKHEAENIYHTTDSKGREHFYLSEYYSHPVYKTVKKRVKVRGRWKWKKVRVVKYYNRDNYVYDLGII